MTDAARAAAQAVLISTTGSRRLFGEGEATVATWGQPDVRPEGPGLRRPSKAVGLPCSLVQVNRSHDERRVGPDRLEDLGAPGQRPPPEEGIRPRDRALDELLDAPAARSCANETAPRYAEPSASTSSASSAAASVRDAAAASSCQRPSFQGQTGSRTSKTTPPAPVWRAPRAPRRRRRAAARGRRSAGNGRGAELASRSNSGWSGGNSDASIVAIQSMSSRKRQISAVAWAVAPIASARPRASRSRRPGRRRTRPR